MTDKFDAYHREIQERFIEIEHRLTRLEVIILLIGVTVWGSMVYGVLH